MLRIGPGSHVVRSPVVGNRAQLAVSCAKAGAATVLAPLTAETRLQGVPDSAKLPSVADATAEAQVPVPETT